MLTYAPRSTIEKNDRIEYEMTIGPTRPQCRPGVGFFLHCRYIWQESVDLTFHGLLMLKRIVLEPENTEKVSAWRLFLGMLV